MNRLEELLDVSDEEKERRGMKFTPVEIAHQPRAWTETAEMLVARAAEIADFLGRCGLRGRKRSIFVLSGAGTSEFIGNAVLHTLRAGFRREGYSLPTTYIVTHADRIFLPGHSYVIVHFSRSGDSPESLETYRLARERSSPFPQLIITCNKNGRLAKLASDDPNSLCLVLPESTNDRSLVMTGSFTSMTLTALCLPLLSVAHRVTTLAQQLGKTAARIFEEYTDLVEAFSRQPFRRACFLGSGALYGAMQECHLKLTEMTDGRIACRFDSFLGLRHGPKVFIDRDCVVVAALSSDPHVRQYELDLLAQLRTAQQGRGILAICERAVDEIRTKADWVVELCPSGETLTEGHRVITDVVIGQMIGLFKCLELGLKPDNPSASGVIHRVVQGVTIYPRRQK